MTNQEIRTAIVLKANELGLRVGFRGPSDAHLCTIHSGNPMRPVTEFKGRIAKGLMWLEAK